MASSTASVRSDSVPRFKTAQVLAWAVLNPQTLRYWKNVLSPISGRDGRSTGYTLEEVVALAVVNCATTQLNVPISRFADHAQELFESVALHVADSDQPHLVFIHENDITFGTPEGMPAVEALAIVRIDRVLIDVRARMMALSAPLSQLNLF